MSYGMGAPKYQGDKIPEGYNMGQVANFTPEQMKLHQQSLSQLGPDSFLYKLASGDQSQFAQMEAPALRQFAGLQGGIASKYSGQGSFGGRHSSGFQNTQNQAAADFAQQLQSQRMGYQNQAIRDMQEMSNRLLGQRPYERFPMEEEKGFNWGGVGGAALGGAAGFFAGGPMGAVTGAGMGYNMGSSLSGHQGSGSSGGFQSTPGWGDQSGQTNLGAGYDQEFRMNPSAMGY